MAIISLASIGSNEAYFTFPMGSITHKAEKKQYAPKLRYSFPMGSITHIKEKVIALGLIVVVYSFPMGSITQQCL